MKKGICQIIRHLEFRGRAKILQFVLAMNLKWHERPLLLRSWLELSIGYKKLLPFLVKTEAILSMWILVFISVSVFAGNPELNRHEYAVLPYSDSIAYQWDGINRVVAVGDVHGDLKALLKILYKKNLIDRNGHWVAGDAHLVMIGDLIDGGKDSRAVLDFLMALEREVDYWGGKLHVLLGNHELRLLFGDVDSLSDENLKSLAPNHYPNHEKMKTRVLKDFYHADGKYAQWLRLKNLIIVINNVVFVHAGLNPDWFKNKKRETIIGQINSTARYLIAQREYQSITDSALYWTVGLRWNQKYRKFSFAGDLGPTWDRGFGTREYRGKGLNEIPSIKRSVNVDDFDLMMEQLGYEKMVVGHHPVRSGRIYLEHPYWGEKVTVIDTRISEAFDGELTAFEMNLNTENSYAQDLIYLAETFKRPKKENRLERIRAELLRGDIGDSKLLQRCENLRF